MLASPPYLHTTPFKPLAAPGPGSQSPGLSQRNALFLAAGYAPQFAEHSLADAAMDETREAIQTILTAHEPYPALAVDGHWNLVYANRALAPLMTEAAPYLLEPPINVLRLSLHPDGIASRIANLGQWRAHLLQRLRRQYEQTSDPFLAELVTELSGYPVTDESIGNTENIQGGGSIAVPLKLKTGAGTLSFISTTMVFGTPLDVTLSELAIETFLPADAATAAALRAMV